MDSLRARLFWQYPKLTPQQRLEIAKILISSRADHGVNGVDEVGDGVNDCWVTPACCPLAAGRREASVLPLAHIGIAGPQLASLAQSGYWVYWV